MSIDIDDLSYDELLDLNDRILARLKHLDAADTLNAMMKLNLGSKVYFDSGKRGMQVGTLIKFNQKTVTVLTDDGRRRSDRSAAIQRTAGVQHPAADRSRHGSAVHPALVLVADQRDQRVDRNDRVLCHCSRLPVR